MVLQYNVCDNICIMYGGGFTMLWHYGGIMGVSLILKPYYRWDQNATVAALCPQICGDEDDDCGGEEYTCDVTEEVG